MATPPKLMARKEPHLKKTWPPGYEPQPHEPKPLHPLRYLRMRQTALENGATGTIFNTFKNPTANVANPEKARLAVPVKSKALRSQR